MSYFGTVGIKPANNTAFDAFGRFRVSQPETLFESRHRYTLDPLIWETITSGAGTVTHLPNESSADISTGGSTNGNSCARQTYEYFQYHPGKSQLVVLTGVLGAKATNVRKRLGYFSTNNGIFFEQDGSNLKVVLRTNTSGSPVDTAVNQSSWNIDKLDGTRPSDMTFDESKANIFWIDLQWLGVGRVRLGIVSESGQNVTCHEFQNANVNTSVYMTSANLPVRYEITNTGTASGATSLKQICSTVMSEGGISDKDVYVFTANSNVTARTVSSRRSVLSIRAKSTINSITNRSKIVPINFELTADTNNALWELVYNPTFTTESGNLTWTDADSTHSGVQYCIHGDANNGAITGGIVLASGFVLDQGGAGDRFGVSPFINMKYPIALDAAATAYAASGACERALSIVCTSFTGNSSITAAINWSEQH